MNVESSGERKIVQIGHVSGVHGIKGWVKIYSLTEPREAIFEYQPWLLGETRKEVRIEQGKKHGKHLIALLENTRPAPGREVASDAVRARGAIPQVTLA